MFTKGGDFNEFKNRWLNKETGRSLSDSMAGRAFFLQVGNLDLFSDIPHDPLSCQQ